MPEGVAPCQLAAFWGQMADIDEKIAEESAEGYDVDVHLQDRIEWQRERDEFMENVKSFDEG